MSERVVTAVQITPAEIILTWIDSDDVRDKGMVAIEHTMALELKHPSYQDEVQAVVEAALALVDDVMEDWPDKDIATPGDNPDDDEDDDDKSYTGSDD